MTQPVVAVIDIGSNSIKALVAERDPAGGVRTRHTATIDARISTGISREHPRLTEEGMRAGLEAVQTLLTGLAPMNPVRTVLVATSAVRDASNGAEFRARIRTATGHELRVLTGDEEAALVGRGLMEDPALRTLQDFYVFDLGGGSLECLSFRSRQPEQAVSLPLGCVRLTELCVPDPTAPFGDASRRRVADICRTVIAQSAFRFTLSATAPAIFAGGSVTTARAIMAEQLGQNLADTSPLLTVESLRALLADSAGRPLAERREIPGLPPARADVFPTALATLLAVAGAGGFPAFQHSFYNLRYGLAAEMLSAGSPPLGNH